MTPASSHPAPPRVAPGERVVVLRTLGLGDLLTALPALRGLARAYPRAELVLAAPRWLEPVLRLAELPFAIVDARLGSPPPRSLAAPALAVNLHGRGPESHEWLLSLSPSSLVAFCPPRPRLAEAADALSQVPLPPWPRRSHEVARWCGLLGEYGLGSDPADLRIDAARIATPPPREPCAVLHPGAKDAARRWPAGRWAQLARWEAERARRVVLTGSAEERPLALDIAERAGLPSASVVAGETDLGGLAALVAFAEHVVSGDTGVQHLATALGTPSVVLFGPVSPDEWGPSIDRERHIALWAGIDGDPHAETPAEGLLRIGVDDVTEALDRLLACV